MAGDWLKIEKVTPDKPEIRAAARRCGVTLGDAFLGFFRLYRYFDDNTADGWLRDFTTDDADQISGVPGLAASLQHSGWMNFDDKGCHVLTWERHNGKCGKARAMMNRRVEAWRKSRAM